MKKLLSLVLALLMVLGMAACGGSKPAESAAPAAPAAPAASGEAAPAAPAAPVENWKKEVVLTAQSKFTKIDPQSETNFQHTRLYQLVYDRLLYLDTVTQEIEPMLATEWTMSDDGMVYTFKLRDDVTFHNGEKMTADDVVFTWERGLNSSKALVKNFYAQVAECKAVDEYTVEMTLVSPNADFLFTRTFPYMGILNRKACEADPENGILIGTGLWKWEHHEDNDYDSFIRNDNYWGESTPTERIVHKLIPEDSARLIALENGEADYCVNVSVDEIDYVAANKELELIETDTITSQYFNFNMNADGPWQDQNFRTACAHAIDWDSLIIGYKSGYANRATTLYNDIQFGKADMKGHDYNLDLAKEFLAKANYNNEPIVITANPPYSTAALIISDMLIKAGINAQVNEVNSATFTELMREGKFDAAVYQMTFNAAGSDISRLLYSSDQGRASIEKAPNGQKIYELLDEALVCTNEAERIALYAEVQQLLEDDATIIPLINPKYFCAVTKGLEGIKWEANTDFDYRYVKVPA